MKRYSFLIIILSLAVSVNTMEEWPDGFKPTIPCCGMSSSQYAQLAAAAENYCVSGDEEKEREAAIEKGEKVAKYDQWVQEVRDGTDKTSLVSFKQEEAKDAQEYWEHSGDESDDEDSDSEVRDVLVARANVLDPADSEYSCCFVQ